jgi:hypothetical protein
MPTGLQYSVLSYLTSQLRGFKAINMTRSKYVAEGSAPANHDGTKTGEGMIVTRSFAEWAELILR